MYNWQAALPLRASYSPRLMSKVSIRLILLALATSPAVLSADTVVEEIIARVNNQIITRTQYQREKQQIKDEAQKENPQQADQIVADQQKDILRGLIDRQLLLD